MRISFDIDDTLICYDAATPCEPSRVPHLLRHWFREPLRLGTPDLMNELSRRGCRIWIYTTSLRSPGHLKSWLWFYGIRVDGVVNGDRHRRLELSGRIPRHCTKHPPAFKIDLHVDDSIAVQMEGAANGFDVVVVDPGDADWASKVLEAVDRRAARH